MGLSVTFTGAPDGGDGPFDLATATGWSLFAQWADALPADQFGAVRGLAETGVAKGTDRLSTELHDALTAKTPPPDVSHTALLLLGNIGVGDPDETATVTNGDPPDETTSPTEGGDKPPAGGDVATPAELGEIADILAHVYGPEQALALFDAPAGGGDGVRKFWDEQEHPRGKGGRFILKGTAEAYSAAKQNVADALRQPHSAEGHRELVGHLAKLNVAQLHALKQEYGISASAPNKAALVAKLADRLNRGRREGGAGQGQAQTPDPAALGVRVEPQSPKPVTPEHVAGVTASVAKMPSQALEAIKAAGGGVELVADSGITAHPDGAADRGKTPRGWEGSGRTWDNVPGAFDTETGKTIIVANRVGEGHGSANLVLHEHAHAYDNSSVATTARRVSDGKDWQAVHGAMSWPTAYQQNYSEESFAESFAAYYHGAETRAGLPQPVQDFFARHFA